MTTRLQSILTRLREALRVLYGDRLRMVILFGSQARGDSRSDSDVDLMIVLQGPVDAYEEIQRTGEMVTQLSLELDQVLTCVFVDEQDYHTQDRSLFRTVRQEGIPL